MDTKNKENRALVVESDPEELNNLESRLRRFGYRIQRISTGEDAVKELELGTFSLIVVRAESNNTNAYNVCRLLKSGPSQSIPFLITSSEATEETFEQHKKLRTRADGYLKVPYSDDQLYEQINLAKQFVTGRKPIKPLGSEAIIAAILIVAVFLFLVLRWLT